MQSGMCTKYNELAWGSKYSMSLQGLAEVEREILCMTPQLGMSDACFKVGMT